MPCPTCKDTGVIDTGNNDLPCPCPAGDRAMFNVAGKPTPQRGAEVRRDLSQKAVHPPSPPPTPPPARPEYVACIEATPDRSFCGRPLFWEWAFTGLTHANNAVAMGSRLVPCPECLKAAKTP